MITYAHANGHVRYDNGDKVLDPIVYRLKVEQKQGEEWVELKYVQSCDALAGWAVVFVQDPNWHSKTITGEFRIVEMQK